MLWSMGREMVLKVNCNIFYLAQKWKLWADLLVKIVKLCLNTYLVSSLFYSSIKHVYATRQKMVITAIFVVCQEQDGIYRYLLCKSCILVILNLFKISFRGASKYPEHIILHAITDVCPCEVKWIFYSMGTFWQL